MNLSFGVAQVILGIGLLAASLTYAPYSWALVWPGTAVLIIGGAYLGPGPRIFGKDTDTGQLHPLRRALLLPYLGVAWLLWQLKSRLAGEAPHDEVAPGVWVGRRPLNDAEMPPSIGVVIDLTCEFPRASATREAPRWIGLPTLDTAAPDAARLRALVDELEAVGEPLFFHCAMGHGRSATAAGALLLRRGLAADVNAVESLMKRRRASVHLRRGQRALLQHLQATDDRGDRVPLAGNGT